MSLRAIVLTAVLAGAGAGSAAAWHNHLTKSAPAADEKVAQSPTTIRLWFAEKPVAKFTSISLLKSDSSKVAIGQTKSTDDSLSVSADVSAPLTPGSYVVSWKTAGDDGHAIRGKYSFTVGQ
jgi:methionine-rich copper-binding protein CopC